MIALRTIATTCAAVVVISTGQLKNLRGESPSIEKEISYSDSIEPIFRSKCQGCHQPAKAQGGLDMVRFEHLLGAGESQEAAIVPGKPAESYLIEQIAVVDGNAAMPKKGPPLSESEIDLIRDWIKQGAKNDSTSTGPKYDPKNPPVYSRAPIITSLSYSPDGEWIAISGFQEVLIVDSQTLAVVRRLVGSSERIESVCFSSDSARLAVTGGSPGRMGEVQVWDVRSGELTLSHQLTYDTIAGGAFSPDGKLIAFGCTDNTVRAIDSETGEQKLHQGAHDDWIRSCVFTPDGKHILSAARDMTVKLTEVETERFVDNVTSITPGALRGGANSLAMHPERNEFLVGGADGTPKVYRVFRETQRRIGDDANLIRAFPAMTGRIFGVDISPDGNYLAAASTLDGNSWLAVYPYNFDGTLPDDVKAAMAKTVASRTADEKKLVASYTTDIPDAAATVSLEGSTVYSIAFSADCKRLVVGGGDGHLRIVDVESGKIINDFNPFPLSPANEVAKSESVALSSASGLKIASEEIPQKSSSLAVPKGRLEQLLVSPSKIELSSSREYAQLVVTAVYSSGEKIDVTREVDFRLSDDSFFVSKFGLVRPKRRGEGEIGISYQSLTESVAVLVSKASSPDSTDFVRDVNPLLSRMGCNAGTCHGAQKGKKGFKLSLRGYDPLEDIRALSDDLVSRRLNSAAPDASLMLLKTLGKVPHEGGVLLTRDSVYYDTLRSWIAEGAQLDRSSKKVSHIEIIPAKPVIERENSWQQFRVVAHYPNGQVRDVTQEAFVESGDSEIVVSQPGGRVQAIRRGEAPVLARYEGAYAASTVTVMGDRSGFVWKEPETHSTIDSLVANKWERMKIAASDICTDAEFLRRVRLDITGLPPTSAELKQFLSDQRPSKAKRREKIDELIGSADYVDHWANKWADLLQVNSKFIGTEGAKAFRNWIRDAVDDNTPYDEFARSVLTASGSNKKNPAASYYKILREPDLMMENTTHLFLAVRFNCNKCHDHPFEKWTQDQYYELAAFFAQTGLKEDPESKGKKIGGTAVEGAKPLFEEVFDRADGEMLHVRTGKSVAPAFPYDTDFQMNEGATRRQQLAAWITSPDNQYFARSYVNRIWGYLTGTGLVEPLDDIRAGNPPTNPELLDHLTTEFIDSGFDVEHVLRLICNSRTYQLSVATNRWNEGDNVNYSHAKARRLPAEVLYDAVYRVTGAVSSIPGVDPGTRAAALPDVALQLPDGFLNNLGRPVRESACECERSDGLQLGPVMALVSGPTIGKAISDPKCALPEIASDQLSEREMIREIYLRVLNREATDSEVEAIVESGEGIVTDHERLGKELTEREKWWVSERERLEAIRVAALAEAKNYVVARKAEIKDERTKMEAHRLEKLAAAKKELAAYAETSFDLASTYLDTKSETQNWFPLAPRTLATTNKVKLLAQEDRSILASGDAGKGTYTINYRTPLKGIRGFRLEALPVDGLPGGGPGLPANGNFVVTEVEVDVAQIDESRKKTKKKRVAIASGEADFTQSGFNVNQVFDGRAKDQRGWAVSPRGGTVHWATFQFTQPIETEGDTELTFTIHQYHNAADHRLARFRISVTTDEGDVELGIPEAFAAARAIVPKQRNKENLKSVISYLEKNDPKWDKLRMAVANAKKPLPDDAKLVQLEAEVKSLETETSDDRKLVQLRKDFSASKQQVGNQRLTLAQDLTWALINSPAFLFNH